jgi:hypothetical protein
MAARKIGVPVTHVSINSNKTLILDDSAFMLHPEIRGSRIDLPFVQQLTIFP